MRALTTRSTLVLGNSGCFGGTSSASHSVSSAYAPYIASIASTEYIQYMADQQKPEPHPLLLALALCRAEGDPDRLVILDEHHILVEGEAPW
jgi:hypothetical protein